MALTELVWQADFEPANLWMGLVLSGLQVPEEDHQLAGKGPDRGCRALCDECASRGDVRWAPAAAPDRLTRL